MVANWHFNYEPAAAAGAVHPPIATSTNAPSASATPPPASPKVASATLTNAATAQTNAAAQTDPPLKSALISPIPKLSPH